MTHSVRRVDKRPKGYPEIVEYVTCLICGGEIVWNPVRGDYCDSCLARAGDKD